MIASNAIVGPGVAVPSHTSRSDKGGAIANAQDGTLASVAGFSAAELAALAHHPQLGQQLLLPELPSRTR
jgi:hypothetical protein